MGVGSGAKSIFVIGAVLSATYKNRFRPTTHCANSSSGLFFINPNRAEVVWGVAGDCAGGFPGFHGEGVGDYFCAFFELFIEFGA